MPMSASPLSRLLPSLQGRDNSVSSCCSNASGSDAPSPAQPLLLLLSLLRGHLSGSLPDTSPNKIVPFTC